MQSNIFKSISCRRVFCFVSNNEGTFTKSYKANNLKAERDKVVRQFHQSYQSKSRLIYIGLSRAQLGNKDSQLTLKLKFFNILVMVYILSNFGNALLYKLF